MMRNDPFAAWNNPFGQGEYRDKVDDYERTGFYRY